MYPTELINWKERSHGKSVLISLLIRLMFAFWFPCSLFVALFFATVPEQGFALYF
jgi:hypothetical protein